MDEINVTISDDFLKEVNEAKMLSAFLAFLPGDLKKQAMAIFRAFAKHGVTPDVVMKALADLGMEGGSCDG